MAYCTRDNVTSVFKNLNVEASGTAIIQSELDDWIDEAGAYIDSYIGSRYALPVTGASTLLLLRGICVDLVAYKVAVTLNLKNDRSLPNGNVVQELSHSSPYREAIKFLKAIKDGKAALPDEDTELSASGLSSLYTESDYDIDINPVFKKTEQQW